MATRHPRFHQTPTHDGYYVGRAPKHPSAEADDDAADHVSETVYPDNLEDIKKRIRYLQTSPWDLEESLWHAYVAPQTTIASPVIAMNDVTSPSSTESTNSMLIFRGHHALADGASIAAAFMDLLDEGEEFQKQVVQALQGRQRNKARTWLQRIKRRWLRLLWLVKGSLQALFYQMYLFWMDFLWDSHPWNEIQQAASEISTIDRTVAMIGTVASVDQVKWVAQQLGGPNATINDLFVSCVTAALAKQLEHHRQRLQVIDPSKPTLPVQRSMHIAVPVHLKGGFVLPTESVGNNLGAFVARLPGEGPDAESRFASVHRTLHAVKSTPAPLLSNFLAKSLSYSQAMLPSRLTAWIFAKSSAGSVVVVTNTRGSPTPVHLGGRLVETMFGFVPLPPGVPVGVVVGSYAGSMHLTLTAEPWAVPDGDQFLAWVLEEYLKLLSAARRRKDTDQASK